MILVSCKARDEGVSRSSLESSANDFFPHPENSAYIGEITSRKNENARADSLLALSLLANLCDRLMIDRTALILSRTDEGRPFFKGSSLDFSISHSNQTVAVALSDRVQVGIDLELSFIDQKRAIMLAERYFAPEEAEAVRAGATGSDTCEVEVFRNLWTEKEAYAKMMGIPLANILSSNVRGSAFFFRLDPDGTPVTLCASSCDEIEII